MREDLRIGFIGNPNCGKTTLFNAFTGAKLKVANWPGVTVEKVEGAMKYHGHEFKLVDLPGTYSLTSYTMEETVARECIMSGEVAVIVNHMLGRTPDQSFVDRSLDRLVSFSDLNSNHWAFYPIMEASNSHDHIKAGGSEQWTGINN